MNSPVGTCIVSHLGYYDATEAVEFLTAAFGFVEKARYTYPRTPSRVMHAELIHGTSILLVSSIDELGNREPFSVEPAARQTLYVVVDDVAAHHSQAVAGGARILQAPVPFTGSGALMYRASDPEGYEWNFASDLPYAAGTAGR